MEDRGPVIFTVTVIGGTALDRDVVVSFSTVDGSTPGGCMIESGRSNWSSYCLNIFRSKGGCWF